MTLRVLVVDDEQRVASTLQAYLEDEGMDVVSLKSAEDALDLVMRGERFDVCVMDMRLPGMDGNAAIRKLHRLSPQMKYIIHTGTPGYTVPDDLRALGVSRGQLFLKPLHDLEPLAATVRGLERVG